LTYACRFCGREYSGQCPCDREIKAICGCSLKQGTPYPIFNIKCDEHTAWEVYGDYEDVNGGLLDSLMVKFE